MSSNPLVSVIVPVYNVEPYLRKCIESILSQTLRDFELLLIDDGSKDNSGAICDSYTNLDTRVKVLHKTNAGVSAARNDGIEMAAGRYITFVDSDDTLDNIFLEDSVKAVQLLHADLFLGSISMETWNGEYIEQTDGYVFAQEEVLSVKQLLEQAEDTYPILCVCGPTCKLYDAVLIRNNNLRFDRRMDLGEDTYFNLAYYRYANNVYISNHTYYHYRRWSTESLFSRFHADTYRVTTLIHASRMDLMEQLCCSAESIFRMKRFHYNELLGAIHSFFRFHRTTEEKKAIIREVMEDPLVQCLSLSQMDGIKNKMLCMLLKGKSGWAIYSLFSLYYGRYCLRDV